MNESPASNVTPLHPPKPFGPAEMSAWFHKLATHLGKDLSIVPTGFLVVLLNDEEIRVWSAGTPEIRDEAALAAKDSRDHQKFPGFCEAPEVAREQRRARAQEPQAEQDAYTRAHPFTCPVCHRDYTLEATYRRHQARCWTDHWSRHCGACDQWFPTYAAYRAHPCMEPSDESRAAQVPRLTLVSGETTTTEERTR